VNGYRIDGLVAEITNSSAVLEAHERAESLLGGVDILVVAAGIIGPTAPIWESDEIVYRHIMEAAAVTAAPGESHVSRRLFLSVPLLL
jgi:NAD(P)-dependent dehydrogenase (short-subunit alcohol dehydrogenase family)